MNDYLDFVFSCTLPNPYTFVVSNRIRELRSSTGLTQVELASLCGVTKNTISDLERNKRQPHARLCLLLCLVFNCQIFDLFVLKDGDSV